MPAGADVVVVGAGHNGLVAAAYLARAGRRVLVLERSGDVGGAAVSQRPWRGVDARVSRYAYLVSLLSPKVVGDLRLRLRLVRRRVSSYTPVPGAPARGILRAGGPSTPLQELTGRVARAVFPTLTEPLRGRDELRALVADDEAWEGIFERPIGELVERHVADDTERGVALTDALIGTLAGAHDEDLRQNRCFLYHVIGGGTGDWDVPAGGMGAVTRALETAALQAGAEIACGCEVSAIEPEDDGVAVRWTGPGGREEVVRAGHVLVGAAPAVLDALLGRDGAHAEEPEGAQLKVNMLLGRLPRLRDHSVAPSDAFSGTFHVNEGYRQLQAALEQARAGRMPEVVPCEVYCHSLTDPSILGDEVRSAGAHTLTCFALHLPARLFRADPDGARARALEATLRSLDSVLAEPIEDVLWRDADGRPCVEARTPLDLEAELALPGGHIFHRDLAWPFAEADDEVGTWGVETEHPRVLLCGAGARRGGGVSGVPGHNAAMAVLGAG